MAEIEKIEGNAILQLLEVLQKDKVPLKMRLAEDTAEHLTHISDIRKHKRKFQFKINSQATFPTAADDADGSQLLFEFTDKENIKFVFETGSGEISRGTIWVRFPEFIYRYQRRSLFRLEAPPGTKLYFTVDDTRYKLLVINVSLGGTLGVLVSLSKKIEDKLQSHKSNILKNVELVFPSKGEAGAGSIVIIKRCRMIRHARNPITKKFECAMEFKEIREDEQRKLRELFYVWQRDYLRKRRLLRA